MARPPRLQRLMTYLGLMEPDIETAKRRPRVPTNQSVLLRERVTQLEERVAALEARLGPDRSNS